MFPMVIWTKCQKVTKGVYFRYGGTIRKLRNSFTMRNLRMLVVTTHMAGLFDVSLKKDQTGMFRDAISKGLPVFSFRDKRTFCLVNPCLVLVKKLTGSASRGNWIGFVASTIWADVTRSKLALFKLFVIKGSRTRLITKFLFLSQMNTFNHRNNSVAVQTVIGRLIVQFFGTFKTNFIGGCTTEPMCFNGKHSFSFRYANAYGRILSKITLIAGRVNETFRIITGWSSPAARQVHTLEVASSNLAPVTNKATC